MKIKNIMQGLKSQNNYIPHIPAQVKKNHIQEKWDIWVKMSILVFITYVLVFFITSIFKHTDFLNNIKYSHDIWFSISIVYVGIYYCINLWRIYLWWRYRPLATVNDEELPYISVVIPAYNEGSLVKDSIRSVVQNNYPENKLQIIAVDDGSTDNTWHFIQEAVSESKGRVESIRQAVNKGKRHALYAAFQQAKGEVWVTIDSDSIIEKNALRNGVSPIVRDKKIGLVAGCVKVLNQNDSFITRLLKVQFVMSFSFSRAYQSMIRGLLTTPGALTFYRASAVKPVLQKWLFQSFMGVSCRTGEDRAMTNLITAQGFHSFYQSTAIVWAEMPTTYSGMTKMILRWDRSNIRETMILMSYIFKPFRRDYLWGFRINSVMLATTLVMPYIIIAHSYVLILTSFYWMLHHFVIVTLFSIPLAIIYYCIERDSDFIWIIAYNFFWFFSCQWIMPFAFLTIKRQGSWMTRTSSTPQNDKLNLNPVNSNPNYAKKV